MHDVQSPPDEVHGRGRDLFAEEMQRHEFRVKRRHWLLLRVLLGAVLLECVWVAYLRADGGRLVTGAVAIIGIIVMVVAIRRWPRPAAYPDSRRQPQPPAPPADPPSPPMPTAPPVAPVSAQRDGTRSPMPDEPSPTSAGLPLLRGRHSVQAVTIALVGAVVLAMLTAGTALLVAVAPGGRPAGASAPSSTDPGPGGFAADCVKLVLRAGEDKRTELRDCYGDTLPDLAGVPAGSFDATGATARQVSELSPGYWSVLVAVDQVERLTNPNTGKATWRPVGLRYYRLGVARRAGRLVAVDLPAPVAPPPVADSPDLTVAALDQPNPTDPRTDRLSRFFGSFLAGAGALEDSVLPGKRATPIDPPPFTTVSLRAVGYDTDEAQPAANARVVVAATTEAGNVQVLGYSLHVVRRDGRWYVASLDGAPTLTTG
jgi:hypothetical protein